MKKVFLTGLALMAFTLVSKAQTETPTQTEQPPAETPAPPPTDGTTTDGTTPAVTDGTVADPAAQPVALDSLGNPVPVADPAAAAPPAAPEKPRYKLYSGKHRGYNSVTPK